MPRWVQQGGAPMDDWVQKHRGYLVLTLLFLIALGVVSYWRRPLPAPIAVVEPSPRPTRTLVPLVVHVAGAVQYPGVYILPADSRIRDAVLAAGGPSAEADVDALNLAAPLRDGQRFDVPARQSGPLVTSLAASSAAQTGLPIPAPTTNASYATASMGMGTLDINRASAAELETLPGIGAVLARRIVDDREANGPFESIEQLTRVRGIGSSLLERLRPYVAVR